MEFKQFLSEMPITSFNTRGDWSRDAKRKYGFNSQDAGIIGNEKAVEKIKKMWSNSKEEFDLYFVREKNSWKFLQEGEVTPEWVKENLKFEINPRPEAISVIYTNNTAGDKVPMTAWTIAHRFGHVIYREKMFNNIIELFRKELLHLFNEFYNKNVFTSIYHYDNNQYAEREKILKALVNSIGTMKSARNGEVRNFVEFIFEIIAQYLLTGSIKFNPLPNFLVTRKRMAWGRPNNQGIYGGKKDELAIELFNDRLDYLASQTQKDFDKLFSSLRGKIFVM